MNREEYAQMYRLEDTHWWFVARRNLVVLALKRLLKSSPTTDGVPQILDVGCGTGGTMERLAALGEVTGIDLEPLALDFSRERGQKNLMLASATDLPFPDSTYDAIVALDVLEHIPDHEAAAREIARVLKPGGHLIVTVPAYKSLWSAHDVALMHQRRYRAGEVRRLLTGAGLTLTRLTYTVSGLLPAVWAVRTAQKLRPKAGPPRADAVPTAPALNRLLRAWLDAESRVALTVPLPFGLTVFAVATKQKR